MTFGHLIRFLRVHAAVLFKNNVLLRHPATSRHLRVTDNEWVKQMQKKYYDEKYVTDKIANPKPEYGAILL